MLNWTDLSVYFDLLQGIKQTDHFGFICRDQCEGGPSQYMCYVFQCATESLVSPTSVKPCNFIFIFLNVSLWFRWMRWWWHWSRPLVQQLSYKAIRHRSSCAKRVPCMTCTSSVRGSKVDHVNFRHFTLHHKYIDAWSALHYRENIK